MANANWQCPSEWSEWSQWLAAGLHARNRWRLPVLLVGILFARGRRTVTTWLRAAGVSDDYQDYYYFLSALGRKTKSVATQLLLLLLRTLPLPDRLLAVIDDTPTKRYGPKVEGADTHRFGTSSGCEFDPLDRATPRNYGQVAGGHRHAGRTFSEETRGTRAARWVAQGARPPGILTP